jgi:hypothetical protein
LKLSDVKHRHGAQDDEAKLKRATAARERAEEERAAPAKKSGAGDGSSSSIGD